jgi:N-acetylglucosaminyldiphosphoundecaprenol N-acetyl-beta-D-mannosaminyltransferase
MQSPDNSPARIDVGGLLLDAISEEDVATTVERAWAAGQGGSIIPVNVDVARAAARSVRLAQLISRGSIVVADGMPLVWAARLQGDVLPERVAGSALVSTLCFKAAENGKTVYFLGGAEGTPEKAAEKLVAVCPSLSVAGTDSPPFGFDQTEEGLRQTLASVSAASPDLVFVGLGFPRQENLIEQLRNALPHTWFLACGGGISMAAGVVSRASPLLQRMGLEWMHRLVIEPRRLAGRYLRDDLPFALALLGKSTVMGARRYWRNRRGCAAEHD